MSPRLIKGSEATAVSLLPFTVPVPGEDIRDALNRAKSAHENGAAAISVQAQVDALRDRRATASRAISFGGDTPDELARNAHTEAHRIIDEATARAEQIERDASERGLSEGRAAVAAEINQAIEPLRDRLLQTVDDLSTFRATFAQRCERDLIRLALEIARKVVHREVTVDPEIVVTLAKIALDRLHNNAVATIRLHPDEIGYITARRDRLEAGTSIQIVEDRSISRGGCIVQTEVGDVDARIEQQFAEIERGFMSV